MTFSVVTLMPVLIGSATSRDIIKLTRFSAAISPLWRLTPVADATLV